MKNKVFLIGISAILLSLIAVTVPVSARARLEWAPEGTFTHYWTGTLLRTESGIEFWELYSKIRMMVPKTSGISGVDDNAEYDDNVEWVKMTIAWDPLGQKGQVTGFDHYGMNLRFRGLTGTFECNADYHFEVSGRGVGFYRSNGTWYPLLIWAIFKGVFYPQRIEMPLESGRSEATERATLEYGYDVVVGGEIAPVNNLALLAPWVVIATAAVAIGFVVSKRKAFLRGTPFFSAIFPG